METVELFNASERASLFRYFSTRFKWPVVIALPCLLAALASVATWDWDLLSLVVSYQLALLLVVPFRLADDLADRQHDQMRNHNRELCKTKCLKTYYIVMAFSLLVATVLVLVTRGMVAAAILLIASCLMSFWYTVRMRLQAFIILNYHVVLTKYVAFVWILVAPDTLQNANRGWWSALTAYVFLLLWEVVHDETNRGSATARRLAVIEFLLWIGWTLWMKVEHLS